MIARAGLLVSEFWPFGMGGDAGEMLDLLIASFSTIAIAEFEEGEPGEPICCAAACEWLAELRSQHVANPACYYDIIARK